MSFSFSDSVILNIMSAQPVTQRAVAIKGPRKREHSSDSDSSSDSFQGCRDSPSPTLGGSVQRAIKSRKQFHRVIIETPPMHRHTLESHVEDLWRATGAEFKFVRSSFAKSDMGFFEGFPPSGQRPSETTTGGVTRHVVQVPVPGSSITGETIFRVTATSTPSDSSQDVVGASSGLPC